MPSVLAATGSAMTRCFIGLLIVSLGLFEWPVCKNVAIGIHASDTGASGPLTRWHGSDSSSRSLESALQLLASWLAATGREIPQICRDTPGADGPPAAGTELPHHPGSNRGYLVVLRARRTSLSGILVGWITGAHRSMATHVVNLDLPGPLDKLPRSR